MGEEMYDLACKARRDATDEEFANILRMERRVEAMRANVAWRERHLGARAARWVQSQIMFATAVAGALLISASWFRYTDSGRAARMGLAEGWDKGLWAKANPRSGPHWLISDMSPEEFQRMTRKLEEQELRHDAKAAR